MNQEIQKLNEDLKVKIAAALADPKLKAAVESITKASDEDAGTFEVVISTDDQDRHGEIIEAAGWMTDSYMKNPVVLWAHSYCDLPIGLCLSIREDGGKKIAKGRFAPGAANPVAQQVRQLYDAGIQRATSVGGIVHEMVDNRITKFEMVEFSFVPVPANPNALALAAAKNLELAPFIAKGLVIAEKEEVAAPPAVPPEAPPEAPPAPAEAPKEEKAVKADGEDATLIEKVGAMLANLQNEIDTLYVTRSKEILDAIAAEEGDDMAEGQKQIAKEGRVLSKRNRDLINSAIQPMKESIAALETLLEATSPEGGDEEKAVDGGTSKQRSKTAAAAMKEALEAHILSKRVLRAINTATSEALAEHNQRTRK